MTIDTGKSPPWTMRFSDYPVTENQRRAQRQRIATLFRELHAVFSDLEDLNRTGKSPHVLREMEAHLPRQLAELSQILELAAETDNDGPETQPGGPL